MAGAFANLQQAAESYATEMSKNVKEMSFANPTLLDFIFRVSAAHIKKETPPVGEVVR